MSEAEVVPGDKGDSRHIPSVEREGGEPSGSENAIFGADMDSLPPGYFTSAFFLGTMIASGLAIGGVR